MTSYVAERMDPIVSQLDNVLQKIKDLMPFTDQDGNFYMPDGMVGGTRVYRMLQTYVEPETGEPLARLSQGRYVRTEDGEFHEFTE